MTLICCKKAGGLSGEFCGHISEGASQIDLWERERWARGIVLRLQVSKGSAEGLGVGREDEDGGVVASRSKEQQAQNCRAQHAFAQNMAL